MDFQVRRHTPYDGLPSPSPLPVRWTSKSVTTPRTMDFQVRRIFLRRTWKSIVRGASLLGKLLYDHFPSRQSLPAESLDQIASRFRRFLIRQHSGAAGCPGHHLDRGDPLFAKCRQPCITMTFGQSPSIGTAHQRHMGKLRHLQVATLETVRSAERCSQPGRPLLPPA